jgi:flagellin
MVTAISLSSTPLAPALQGNQQLRESLADNAGRLTSGNRILAISDDVGAALNAANLQSQSSGFRQASSNAAQAFSLLDTAAEGLSQIEDIFTNLTALAERATSPAVTDAQRAFLQQQFSQSFTQIDAIVSNTRFNDIRPLEGLTTDFRVGNNAEDVVSIDIEAVTSEDLFGPSLPDIGSIANATAAQTAIDDANETLQNVIRTVQGTRDGLFATSSALSQTASGNQAGAGSLTNTDVAAEIEQQASNVIRFDTSTAVLAQASNLQPQLLQLLNSVSLPTQPQTEQTQDTSEEPLQEAAARAATTTPAATPAPTNDSRPE